MQQTVEPFVSYLLVKFLSAALSKWHHFVNFDGGNSEKYENGHELNKRLKQVFFPFYSVCRLWWVVYCCSEDWYWNSEITHGRNNYEFLTNPSESLMSETRVHGTEYVWNAPRCKCSIRTALGNIRSTAEELNDVFSRFKQRNTGNDKANPVFHWFHWHYCLL